MEMTFLTKFFPRIPEMTFPVVLAVFVFCAGAGGTCFGQSYTTAQLADGFDYPVGIPHGYGYYRARGFTPNGHMGEDWNGKSGGDSDLGDPIYAVANGVVVFSQDYRRGWGNVTIIRHAFRSRTGQINFIDSLYGHLKHRPLSVGQKVSRGDKVGTMGKGPYGMYPAHLHFEIRKDLRVGMRRELYAKNYDTYYKPYVFIDSHRQLRYESRLVRVPINTFLRSNPNRIVTEKIEVPKLNAPTTVRPDIPAPVEDAITQQTSEESTKPAKTKSIFQRLFGK